MAYWLQWVRLTRSNASCRPIGAGLFVPIDALPPALQTIARMLPLTYAVTLLRGIWRGEGWLAHAGSAAVLALVFVIFTAAASKVFRWQ